MHTATATAIDPTPAAATEQTAAATDPAGLPAPTSAATTSAATPLDPGAASPAASPAAGPAGVLTGRERIDAIDAELIALIQRRVSVSGEIQSARLAEGGRRLDLRRETEVIGRYTRTLGRPGTAVAMALLELGRGRV